MKRTAIVSAMQQELQALQQALEAPQTRLLAGREFHSGVMHGQPVVLVRSGIGKVAAATTATLLLHAFEVDELIFTGVAGGLGDGVQVGDVVVAERLVQHDMDASPLFPRFEVPLYGRSHFAADAGLAASLADAARCCMRQLHPHLQAGTTPLRAFGIEDPGVHCGLVASGDRFVSSAAESRALRALLPEVLAVEMEGAALAQVCADFQRPFAVLRTVSDRADDTAHVDFVRFISEVASVYTSRIVGEWLHARRAAADAAGDAPRSAR